LGSSEQERMQCRVLFGAVLGLVLLGYADSLMFHLQPGAQKCLREEIHKDVLVSGDYEITEVPGQTVDLAVSKRFILIRL